MPYKPGRCLLVDRLRDVGMTQQELADKEGFTRQQISEYATGKRKMSYINAITIAEALDCHPRDLYELIPVKKSERRRQPKKMT
ncbi:helix-turn-helix domain-containing protein [Paenibacillus sp. MBLB4367]|uniref:helix-turn-helix domain-containing protein n=1 Tax=Paenibacillus sp. MBLB4367 TaxID=3384767 RepID=UPI003907EADC